MGVIKAHLKAEWSDPIKGEKMSDTEIRGHNCKSHVSEWEKCGIQETNGGIGLDRDMTNHSSLEGGKAESRQ